MAMYYRDIIYLQGGMATEALALLADDTNKALEYLKQWDYGDSPIVSAHDLCKSDSNECIGDYIIGYNELLEYIYLLRLE